MKFRINRDHFANGLQQVLNVVGPRASMPILGNVLIETGEDSLALTTTNLDLGIRCQVRAEVTEAGRLTLPVRALSRIVRQLPNLEVELESSGGGEQAKIQSGGSSFRLRGLSPEDFPPLPTFDNQHVHHMTQSDLVSMLSLVSYAQSTDESRYMLNGVYFHFEENDLTLVATDGRRMGMVTKEMELAPGMGAPEGNAETGSTVDGGSLILPAKTVTEVERLLGKGHQVKIAFNERQVAFDIAVGGEAKEDGLLDNLYLVSKVVEGRYPNYRQVIPKETEHRIKIERELLEDCVKRASLVASDKNHSVRFRLTTNLLEISSKSPEVGEAHESMAIAYDGPEVQVSFNPSYLLDPLGRIDQDEVYFEFKDENCPGVFKTTDRFLCVIMPLRPN